MRSLSQGGAIAAGIAILVLMMVGYSYLKYGNFTSGLYEFSAMFATNLVPLLIFTFGLFVMGYLLGRAY